MPRDFNAELRRVLDEATGDGPYRGRVVASEVCAKLEEHDIELLKGWLWGNREQIVWQAINDRDRSVRAHVMHRRKPDAFAKAIKAAEHGDPGDLKSFLDVPYKVANGDKVRLGSLRGPDCLYIAAEYRENARRSAMKATFFEALAKKIGNDRVEDHYTHEQISRMFASYK